LKVWRTTFYAGINCLSMYNWEKPIGDRIQSTSRYQRHLSSVNVTIELRTLVDIFGLVESGKTSIGYR
jgi:hypothetical protein